MCSELYLVSPAANKMEDRMIPPVKVALQSCHFMSENAQKKYLQRLQELQEMCYSEKSQRMIGAY